MSKRDVAENLHETFGHFDLFFNHSFPSGSVSVIVRCGTEVVYKRTFMGYSLDEVRDVVIEELDKTEE